MSNHDLILNLIDGTTLYVYEHIDGVKNAMAYGTKMTTLRKFIEQRKNVSTWVVMKELEQHRLELDTEDLWFTNYRRYEELAYKHAIDILESVSRRFMFDFSN